MLNQVINTSRYLHKGVASKVFVSIVNKLGMINIYVQLEAEY